MKTQNSIKNYEIRVKGHLCENSVIWFEDFQIEYTTNGETILRGPIIDQAALHGILNCIRDLGLTLTLVRQEE